MGPLATLDWGLFYDWSSGVDLGAKDTVRLFADLVRTGLAGSLDGHVGRSAASLIDNGTIDSDGKILIDLDSA